MFTETAPSAPPRIVYSRKNPFPAALPVRRKLTEAGSEKETFHYEFSLEQSGLVFEIGDSLGVFPANAPELVEEIIVLLGFGGDEDVTSLSGESVSLRTALLRDRTITTPSRQFVQSVAERISAARFLLEYCEPAQRAKLDSYLWGRHVVDFLIEYPELRNKFSPGEFVGLLSKLQPRLYSIASSLKRYPEAAHLLVTSVQFVSNGRPRQGVCTSFLSQRVKDATRIPVFVHTAKHFRLPEDPGASIIMIGVGTGLAPYRAFLQEREATGATGRNWLFFGEQRRAVNFYYERDWEEHLASGLLTRLDTAFSRDQDYKVYVQHRLREAGREIWSWLNDGAYLYLCGDAERMAPDVDAALQAIAEEHGGMNREAAVEYIADLRARKRYRRDVY
ncbi:MAG: sulfite reductase flavoprotein alpha-component [Verrucomicrobiota bacterium]|jgi:sulfite reductase (NADPH) flavoprotein alpha-component